MPPKKVVARAAAGDANAAMSAQQDGQIMPDNLNDEHSVEFDDAIKVILGHPMFEDIQTAAPIGIKRDAGRTVAGHQAGLMKHHDSTQVMATVTAV